jgi:predicted O-methyltransferase YrrM
MLLRSSLRRLDECIRAGEVPDASLVSRLVRGWENEAWSADVPLLAAMLDWLPKTSGTILECGSGLSTLVMGTVARVSGRRVFSLEHDPHWAARLERSVPQAMRDSIDLCVTPICNHGAFDWYSVAGVRLPNDIGFVLCDGPPGGTRGGRYGLGPILMSLLAPGCIVLLDDTRRFSEQQIMNEWCAQFGAAVVHESSTYHVLEVRQNLRERRKSGR